MNLKSLETLLEIHEVSSFAKTAKQLNMTVSTVSMQMKALEDELGVQLFDRSHRPPRLTPVGRMVVNKAGRVVKEAHELAALCQGNEDDLVGTFKFGFVHTASVRLLPTFLTKARKAFPRAHFNVETGLSDDLINRVMGGHLDAAIVTNSLIPDELSSHVLTHEELVYCLPTERADDNISALFAELPFVHFMPQTGIGRLIARYLEHSKLIPSEVIILDSVEAVVSLVRAGGAFSILPVPDVARLGGRDVTARSVDGEALTRDLVLCHPFKTPVATHLGKIVSAFTPAFQGDKEANLVET